MTEKQARKIFNQYNRAIDIIRCPNGKVPIRKLLDSYARAAVNLYGTISRDDFVDIFNRQNSSSTNKEEIYLLLLPLVFKNGWYGFYQDYIVHYSFLTDFDQADYLLKYQADKPRYIPEKNEFLKYVNEDYIDNDNLLNLRRFMFSIFGTGQKILKGYQDVVKYIVYGDGIKELGPILDKYGLIFYEEKQLQELMNHIMSAKNSTRIWENKGYTPSELHEIFSKRRQKIIQLPTTARTKVGRNDPCPCGSGKKYKMCCALFDDNQSAQLSADECRLFYETWYGLMGYVNEQKHVIKTRIKPEYPNTVNDMLVHKVREVLWKNPELIDDYIRAAELPQEKIDILKLWKAKHKGGMFFILAYHPEYAVLIASNEQGEDRLFGIKGISNSVANTLRRELPVQIETVLLPFKGKIIYDSFISTMAVQFAEGAKAAFREMYDNALEHGIFTDLE